MAKFRFYRCPECGGTFRHLHHPDDAPPPDRCQLCHAWVSEGEPPEPVFVPQAPGIKKSEFAKSVDQTYRATEAASVQRAEDAADQLRAAYAAAERESPHEGDRAILDDMERHQIDEMRSGLKITNMRDPSEMREGDSAVIQPSADAAAARLTMGASRPGFQTYEGPPPNHAPGVGPSNSGDMARQAVVGSHAARASQMISAGQLAPAYIEKR